MDKKRKKELHKRDSTPTAPLDCTLPTPSKSAPRRAFFLNGFALSDVGCVRKRNEDAFAMCVEEQLFVLADGMGGHRGGDVASKACVNGFCAIVKDALDLPLEPPSPEGASRLVRLAIEEVNRIIYRMGQQDMLLKGMGTTFCALLALESFIVYAHVGDSRIYLFQEGTLLQLTQDHSLMRELLEMGQLSEREASIFPYKNVLTRAIGTEQSVDPTIQYLFLKGGEHFLICSDGLTEHLSKQEIQELLRRYPKGEEATQKLLEIAKSRGGHDNITLLLIETLPEL